MADHDPAAAEERSAPTSTVRAELDVELSRACVKAWDASRYTSGDCDAVHPMFAFAFDAGARAALAAPKAEAPITPAYINSLPQPLRDYIHELHSNTDPAGTVREVMQLRDANAGLQAMYRKAADGLQYVTECFEAAMHEGLIDALAATEDERLKDLVERRLMYANNKAHEVLAVTERAAPPTSPAPQEPK